MKNQKVMQTLYDSHEGVYFKVGNNVFIVVFTLLFLIFVIIFFFKVI